MNEYMNRSFVEETRTIVARGNNRWTIPLISACRFRYDHVIARLARVVPPRRFSEDPMLPAKISIVVYDPLALALRPESRFAEHLDFTVSRESRIRRCILVRLP